MKELSPIWQRIQRNLFPHLRETLDPLTEKQERLICVLEVIQIERYVGDSNIGCVGRPKSDRQALARAFVVKAFYNMTTTEELIERLKGSPSLRRICGWERRQYIPDAATFFRAFLEFSQSRLPEFVHKELIQTHHGEKLVGHLSRDSTEIEAREKPKAKEKSKQDSTSQRKRGRPKKGEPQIEEPLCGLKLQKTFSLHEMLTHLPKACDRGLKKNSKGYTHAWNGYKLHIDTADTEIPISCILTSASVHDSQVALPLSHLSRSRVTNCYDVMDSAYDAQTIQEHCQSLGHIPIIDSNPRRGEKREMDPATQERYKTRTSAERTNARLKDEFGGRMVRVKGHSKVMSHLMFGILALTADQLVRLVL